MSIPVMKIAATYTTAIARCADGRRPRERIKDDRAFEPCW
jgi:hypothetical protein